MIEKVKALIKDGFLHIMGGSVLIKLMGFISNIFVIRLVTKSEFGYLAYADNLYSYVTVISGLGMATALIVKCGGLDITDRENAAFFKYAVSRGGFVQIVGALLVLIYFVFFTNDFRNATPFMLALFMYPCIVYITQCCSCFIRAYQQNKLYSKSAVLQSLVLAICSIVFAALFDAIGIVFSRYIALFALIVVIYKFVIDKICLEKYVLSRNEKSEFLKLAIALLLANIFSDLMFSNEMLLVNKILNDEMVTAEYKVATLLPSQILFVTQSLMVYFLPKFVQIKKGKELWNYAKKVGTFNLVLVVVICLIAIVMTPWLIEFMFGVEYIPSISISRKFWIAYGINVGMRIIPINVLAVSGYEKLNMVLSIIGCLIHFVVAFFVLSYVGIDLLPLALSIAYIAISCFAWGCLYKVCKKEV